MHFQVGIFAEPIDLDETLFAQPQDFQRLALFSAPIRPPFPGGGDERDLVAGDGVRAANLMVSGKSASLVLDDADLPRACADSSLPLRMTMP